MTHLPKKRTTSLLLAHWAVIIAGSFAGILAALFICSYPFDFSGELAEARRLGIVSLTILNGYPKSRDVLCYAALILLPVTFSLVSWLAWSRGRRSELAKLFGGDTESAVPLPQRPLLAALIIAICLLLKFDINNFFEPAGGWAFLGEEGQFLADVQILLGEGDYARDFFCLYGPLVVYPLAWVMKLFGPSVIVGRFYTYGLAVISATILITTLSRTIRSRTVFIVASLVMGALYIEGGGRTSATLLRVILGFVPLLILYASAGNARKLPPFSAGAALGISLLFSQEVGLCAVIATGVFLILEAYAAGTFRPLLVRGVAIAAGCCLVVVPILAYFYRQDSLGRFFESLYGYPKMVTLGYGSLPFPSVFAFLANPLTCGAYLPYWIIGLYIFAAISFVVRLFLRQDNRDLHFRICLLVFGLLLFRAALGRSDDSHYFFALPPALVMLFLVLDDSIRGLGNGELRALQNGRRMLIGMLCVSLVLLLGTSRVLRENVLNVFSELGKFPAKFIMQERGVALPELNRGGIPFDPATAEDLRKIGAALDRYTREGESVFFFPNEAAYYFLFNRSVPTRYVHAYFAVTTEQRREMVAELERHRPACVVYSLDTWRIDDIPEDVQVPEVVDYLREHYILAENLGNVLVLRRKNL